MTSHNLFHLAEAGQLGQSLGFEGYCISAAIDACFIVQDVPAAVYKANMTAVAEGEIGQENKATDRFYELLGSLAFKDSAPKGFMSVPYYFTDLHELQADLTELRGKSTILLDVNDGKHSVGLKPVGENADEWSIVGTHQIVAVTLKGEPIDVQCMIEPEIITTAQVWDYLVANNSPGAERQIALVFPPEPSNFSCDGVHDGPPINSDNKHDA